MMTDADIHYHTPSPLPEDWAETSFFYFYVPEARVYAWVYFVARAAQGAIVADVQVSGDLSMEALGAWYIDIQQHLRMPERFENFALSNGLTFKAHNIRDYRIDYVGVNDTELHVDVTGLMEPYDINDPRMDPKAVADPHADVTSTGFGKAYAAHFDMTCHVRGTLKVRGRDYAIDCVATMDHSWGQRAERGMHSMAWINANFGRDYALQGIWSYEPQLPPHERYAFKHGYALVDGKVRGGVDGRLVGYHMGRFALGYEWSMTDVDGREHRLYGSPAAMHLWHPYTCTSAPNIFVRWHDDTGRVGWGAAQENNPHDKYAGAHLAKRGW